MDDFEVYSPKPRIRTENFTLEEKWALVYMIKKYKLFDTIENVKSDTQTLHEKKRAWHYIATEFNIKFPSSKAVRKGHHVRELWRRLKQRCRRLIQHARVTNQIRGKVSAVNIEVIDDLSRIIAELIQEKVPPSPEPLKIPRIIEALNLQVNDDFDVKPDLESISLQMITQPDTPQSAGYDDGLGTESSDPVPTRNIDNGSIGEFQNERQSSELNSCSDGIGRILSVTSIPEPVVDLNFQITENSLESDIRVPSSQASSEFTRVPHPRTSITEGTREKIGFDAQVSSSYSIGQSIESKSLHDFSQTEILHMRRLEHDTKMVNLQQQRENAKLDKRVMKQRLKNLKEEHKMNKLRATILKLEKQKLQAELKKSKPE